MSDAPQTATEPPGWLVKDSMGFELLFRTRSIADDHIDQHGGIKIPLYAAQAFSAVTAQEAVAWRIHPEDTLFLRGSVVTDEPDVAESWRKAGNRVEALAVITINEPQPTRMTDSELRKIWRDAGGDFHGPKVEHGSMPEEKLLPFLRSLALPRPQNDTTDTKELVEALACAHRQVDMLMAMVITLDHSFMPSRTSLWPDILARVELIRKHSGEQRDALIRKYGAE